MFSRLYYVRYQDQAVYWVLGGLVWVVYVLDRLRDAYNQDPSLRDRHRFHWRFRKLFLVFAALIFLACVAGFFLGVPAAMLWQRPYTYGLPQNLGELSVALFTHGVLVILLALGFFAVGHKQGPSMESVLFKNVLGALTFAFGTAMGAHFYTYNGLIDMVFSFDAIGFAFLCLMNLNAIDLWEREELLGEDLRKRDYFLSLPLLLIGFLSLLAAHFWHEYRKPFYYSMLAASASLLMLDHFRVKLSARLLRVLADVALLVPLPIFWFWFKN